MVPKEQYLAQNPSFTFPNFAMSADHANGPVHDADFAQGNTDEYAPLIAKPGTVPEEHDGEEDDADEEADEKPLPVTQIALLCLARVLDPLSFFAIFPYINKMVQGNGRLEDADVGFYSGLIESLFSLTQMLVMVAWGRASDRYGRKPVLVVSLVGVAAGATAFGFSQTIWQMVALRCITGAFAGSVVTIRTMIAEHSSPATQARAFSWFAFTGNLGIMLGPLIGGALADPAGQYQGLFARIPFFIEFPYALSSIAIGAIGFATAFISAMWVSETLPCKKRAVGKPQVATAAEEAEVDDDSSTSSAPAAILSSYELLMVPGVAVVLYVYSHVMLLAFAYTAITVRILAYLFLSSTLYFRIPYWL